MVKKAVLQDALALKDIPIGTHLNRIINVNGVKLQYTIYGRSVGGNQIYNVGRIHGIK